MPDSTIETVNASVCYRCGARFARKQRVAMLFCVETRSYCLVHDSKACFSKRDDRPVDKGQYHG